jgi:hypothetical protein
VAKKRIIASFAFTFLFLGGFGCGAGDDDPGGAAGGAGEDGADADAGSCDAGNECSRLRVSYPHECALEKLAMNQDSGCRNDGSVEFCIDAADAALLTAVRDINPDVACTTGTRGRAECDTDSEMYCAFPTGADQCVQRHGAMTDAAWTQLCEISLLDGIERIVATWYE